MESDPGGDPAIIKRLGYDGVRNRRAVVEDGEKDPGAVDKSYPSGPTPDSGALQDENGTTHDGQPQDAFRAREHGQATIDSELRPLPGKKIKNVRDENRGGDFRFHAAHAKEDLELIESQIAEEKYLDRPMDLKETGDAVSEHDRAGRRGER